jgi:hypothetical protein
MTEHHEPDPRVSAEEAARRLAVVRDLLVSPELAEEVVTVVQAADPEYRTRAVTNALVRVVNDGVVAAESSLPSAPTTGGDRGSR